MFRDSLGGGRVVRSPSSFLSDSLESLVRICEHHEDAR